MGLVSAVHCCYQPLQRVSFLHPGAAQSNIRHHQRLPRHSHGGDGPKELRAGLRDSRYVTVLT